MKAQAYMTRTSPPQAIEAPTVAELLLVADSLGALWVVVGGWLVGKTIMGTWATVDSGGIGE